MNGPWRPAGAGVVALLAFGIAPPVGFAQSASDVDADAPEEQWRFPVGETAVYDVTFGPVKVGRSRLVVEAIDTLAVGAAWRVAYEIEGGPFFFKIDDRTVSWITDRPFRSHRFEQALHQGDYRRNRRFELDHAAGVYTRFDWNEGSESYVPHRRQRNLPLVRDAIDEIAYLYLARTLPLEVGKTYRFERYFEPAGNPVVMEVLRKERIRVAAGRFDTIVIRPTFPSSGIFGEGGSAEVYISDDESRSIVLIRATMGIGTLNMYLREYESGEEIS